MSYNATIYRMVTPDHVCPFGIKAKDLLKRQGLEVEDHILRSREEADRFKRDIGVETTPQVFIGKDRIGGYDKLRKYFELGGDAAFGGRYQPIIALFSMTLLMTLALIWITPGSLLTMQSLTWFVALSMCVLALLKLQDLSAFSNQFVTYDLLARRVVPYAYVYPFAEGFVGLGMLADIFKPLVALVALFIGSVGAVSVIKAVYIDRRELKCACVGGNQDVPLGAISLTENLMMVAMGLVWMLAERA